MLDKSILNGKIKPKARSLLFLFYMFLEESGACESCHLIQAISLKNPMFYI
jgi:hypothetical protein